LDLAHKTIGAQLEISASVNCGARQRNGFMFGAKLALRFIAPAARLFTLPYLHLMGQIPATTTR